MTIYTVIHYIYILLLIGIVILCARRFLKTKKWIEKITIVLVIILFLLRIFGIK